MPRLADPSVRDALVETAARLLAEEGPSALTTRRVATEAGTTTMAVYTHFGGKEDLVRAIVWEGFERLAAQLATVPATDDPVADLAELAIAYGANARANPHLYAVMFGGATVPEYCASAEDAAHGLASFQVLVDGVQRCIDAGRFEDRGAFAMASALWAGAHGVITLEQHGYLLAADDTLRTLCLTMSIGMAKTRSDDDAIRQAVSNAEWNRRRRLSGRAHGHARRP